jgi:hypothetical protein
MTNNNIRFISVFLLLLITTSFSNSESLLKSIHFSNERQTLFYGELEIGADLNGDKKIERVYIDVISEITNRHLDSLSYDGSYDDYIKQFEKIKPRIIVKSNHRIPDLVVNDDPDILRPMSIGNLGDLDDDGSDEIGYVLERIELEKTDSMCILSLKNRKWYRIGAVPISISYSERFYSVNTHGLIVKKEGKLYYTNSKGEETEFTLRSINQ